MTATTTRERNWRPCCVWRQRYGEPPKPIKAGADGAAASVDLSGNENFDLNRKDGTLLEERGYDTVIAYGTAA